MRGLCMKDKVLRIARIYSELTLEKASSKICNKASLSRYERGVVKLPEDIFALLMKKYGFPEQPSELVLSNILKKSKKLDELQSSYDMDSAKVIYNEIRTEHKYLIYNLDIMKKVIYNVYKYQLKANLRKDFMFCKKYFDIIIKTVDCTDDLNYNLICAEEAKIRNDIKKATKFYNNAIQIAYELKVNDMFIMIRYAKLCISLGNSIRSLDLFKNAYFYSKIENNVIASFYINIHIADNLVILSQYKQAIEKYTYLIKNNKLLNFDNNFSLIYSKIIYCYLQIGDYEKVKEYFPMCKITTDSELYLYNRNKLHYYRKSNMLAKYNESISNIKKINNNISCKYALMQEDKGFTEYMKCVNDMIEVRSLMDPFIFTVSIKDYINYCQKCGKYKEAFIKLSILRYK